MTTKSNYSVMFHIEIMDLPLLGIGTKANRQDFQ